MADFLLELWKAAALGAMAILERAASAECRSSEGRTIDAIVVGFEPSKPRVLRAGFREMGAVQRARVVVGGR